jgi:2,4-dienoyl-CoA reductase-like NADH-dependent reductase (Old Yellow Enzyme family)
MPGLKRGDPSSNAGHAISPFRFVSLARGMLFDPRWPWHAAEALGDQAAFPPQYMRPHPSMQGLPVPGNPPVAKKD